MVTSGIYERTSGAAGQPLPGSYQRRAPERTVLHELVSRHAQTLLAELRDADGRTRGGEPPLTAASPSASRRAGGVPWAELLRRVFATDVLSCPCGGHRSVIAVVVDAPAARAVLTTLGLPCTPATFAPARDPPLGELWFDDAS